MRQIRILRYDFCLIFVVLFQYPVLGLATQNDCKSLASIFSLIRGMTPEEYEDWQRLLQTEPLQGLKKLAKQTFPVPEKIAIVSALAGDYAKAIIKASETGKTRQSAKMYDQLVKALNDLELDEAVLSDIAFNHLIDPAFFDLLRRGRYAGSREIAAKLSAEIRLRIDIKVRENDHKLLRDAKGRLRYLSLFHKESDDTQRRKFARRYAALMLAFVMTYSAQQYMFSLGEPGKQQEAEYLISHSAGWLYRISGHKAIGWGVYYKLEETEQALGERYFEAKKVLLLARASRKPAEIEIAEDRLIRVIADELYGNFSHWLAEVKDTPHYIAARAQTLIDSPDGAMGIDQQKAVILMTILNDLGIASHLEGGVIERINQRKVHVWVRLDQRPTIIDPTFNFMGQAQSYYDRYVIRGPFNIEAELGNHANYLNLPSEGR